MSAGWFVTHPVPAARLRLYVFPYAGGNPAAFQGWSAGLAPEMELAVLNLPGRGMRLEETPLTDLEDAAGRIAAQIGRHAQDAPGGRFAILGHSMGAVLALEVLRRIAATRGPQGQAQALIVAGCRWPGVLDKTRRLHDLPDPAFRARLREMGGTPDEILDSDDMMALVGPMLRADFAMLHGYTHRAAPPLPVPLHILAARRDAEVAAHHLTRWPEESAAPHPVRWFDAGHFFVHEEQDAVIGTLRDILL